MSDRIARNKEFLEHFITKASRKQQREFLSSNATDDQIAAIVELIVNINRVTDSSSTLTTKEKNCLKGCGKILLKRLLKPFKSFGTIRTFLLKHVQELRVLAACVLLRVFNEVIFHLMSSDG